MKQKRKKGFTLVELSIVLVIIGLLIGGILVGQSMMETARITAQVKQFEQLDAAVNNFVTSYKYLPGDCPICGAPAGNGNGALDGGVTTWGADAGQCQIGESIWSLECPGFWQHMARMRMIDYSDQYASVWDGSSSAGSPNLSPRWANRTTGGGQFNSEPPLAISKTPFPIDARWTKTGGLYWTATSNAGVAKPLTTVQALAIDTKIDDGISNTGNVKAAGLFPPAVNDYITPQATGNDAQCSWSDGCCYSAGSASKYNLANTNPATGCGLQVKANVYP